jgi:hypothetical protein
MRDIDARLADYATAASGLSQLGDQRLRDVVTSASVNASGIGGRSAELQIGGVRVFVKRVPLTDVEMEPRNIRSTANLFELPTFYQYGIGSAGFGAWRELAAHTMTNGWVLDRRYDGFPLLYHWRVLPDTPPEGFVDEFGGVDAAVSHWDGSLAVRHRLEAIAGSSHSLVLFLEYVPQALGTWLSEQREAGARAYAWVEEILARGVAFLSARRFVHFDAHFGNLLTDGDRIYFADFGLALSSEFDLSEAEERFLEDHLDYDRHYTANHLLRHHLVAGVRGGIDKDVFLNEWIAGWRPDDVVPEIAAMIDRHAHSAVVLGGFHRRLMTRSKRTPYPADELDPAYGSPNRPNRVEPLPATAAGLPE